MAEQDGANHRQEEVARLRAENDALQTRVSHLEAVRLEYHRQMMEVLTSASWRATAPLRGVAGKVRLARRRARALPRALRHRRGGVASPTTGLFPPVLGPGTPMESPLLARPLGPGPFRPAPPVDPAERKARVLVVAHVYYPEVWHDIEERLPRIPEPYDLVVTLVEGRGEGLREELASRLPDARTVVVPNHGRDLASLIELAGQGVFEGYDAVLKVHTKRSVHRLDGDRWRITLLDGVLPSEEGVRRVLELLRSDHAVGLIGPTGHVRGPETWGSDQVLVEALASRLPLAFDPDELRYPAGSMYWARPWVVQRLADLQLDRYHFEPEADHLDGSTAHALERYVGVSSIAAGLDVLEMREVAPRLQKQRAHRANQAPRVLAFYLPQYHRTPENDAFWGEGFTDWVNVDKAAPVFAGHRHPLRPAELGHYDLADPSVLRRQAALAREHGVSGFLVHHYWFDGRRVLRRPLENLLGDQTIDFPFALCWANEPWTRSWDGLQSDVLIPQGYEEGYADSFYDDIAPALADPRYLRVGGLPLLVVYRAGHLPDGGKAVLRWKERARADGHGGLHVLGVTPSRDFEGLPAEICHALDGLIRFPPASGLGLQSVKHLAPGLVPGHSGDILSYDAAVDGADLRPTGAGGLRIHPGVMPGWDNTARRGPAGYAFHGANPLSFRRWLAKAVAAADDLVVINAWNEWAEGACLEPEQRFGRAYLEAVRDVVGPA